MNSEFFKNKIILAPMVRMNSLPFRLLALDCGAHIVYSPEIIDHKLLRSERQFNEILGTVDYIDRTDGSLVFRTCSRERDKIILQIGTSCAERASKVAVLLENDVAGIDINMGCPKHFSLSGGMGAALLSNQSKAQDIIQHVRKAVKIPVTCKIRILETVEETISFCNLMKNSGVDAIAVHGRTKKERPQHENRNSVIRSVSSSLSIPVIANGGSNDIADYDDILKFKEDTNCSSVMVARAAQYNPSVFRKRGILDLDDVIKAYLKYAVDYDNCFPNTKYCVQSMLRDLQDTPRGKLFLETQNLEQICELWGLGDYYRQKAHEYKPEGLFVQRRIFIENQRKKFKPDPHDTLVLRCAFIRSCYPRNDDLPRSILFRYSQKCGKPPPKYVTRNIDKMFQSTVTYDGQKYSSTYWEKNKKSAEQGAAIVCLCYLKIYNEDELRLKGIVT